MSNHLKILVVDSPNEAPHYVRDHPDVRSATIDTAIVVRNGTESGKCTVDFQITDADGKKLVAMLTGNLVRNLVAIIDGAEQRTD